MREAEALLAKSSWEVAKTTGNGFEKQSAGKKASDGASTTAAAEHASASADEDEAFVLKVGNGVHESQTAYTPEPQYSMPAKELRIQGVCVLQAIIDKEGKVLKPELVDPGGQVVMSRRLRRFRNGNSDRPPGMGSRSTFAWVWKFDLIFLSCNCSGCSFP